MRYLVLFLTITALFARINPFEPVTNPTNQVIIKPKYFKEAKVYMPKDAKVLKKIVFVYQNVSGDVKQKEILINKNIDFHSPIIVTHSPKIFKMQEYDFNLFNLFIKNRKIFIQTKDRLLRDMFLIKPFRLVLDFKKNATFLTIKRKIPNSFVKKVIVGNHSGYYRVVIYFDANYKYKLTKMDDGVKIEFE